MQHIFQILYNRNAPTLTNANSLCKLTLSQISEANIKEIAEYKNLIKLDILRKDDSTSLSFLLDLPHLEEFQLWHQT